MVLFLVVLTSLIGAYTPSPDTWVLAGHHLRVRTDRCDTLLSELTYGHTQNYSLKFNCEIHWFYSKDMTESFMDSESLLQCLTERHKVLLKTE